MTYDDTLTCSTCEETKPLTAFYKDGMRLNRATGKLEQHYRRDCKECYYKTRKQNKLAKQRRKR